MRTAAVRGHFREGRREGEWAQQTQQQKSAAAEERHFGARVEAGGSQSPETSTSATEEGHARSSAACLRCQGSCPFAAHLCAGEHGGKGTGQGMSAWAVHRVESCPADDTRAASTSQCRCVTVMRSLLRGKQRFTFEQMLGCSQPWHTSDVGETAADCWASSSGPRGKIRPATRHLGCLVTAKGFPARSFSPSLTAGQRKTKGKMRRI